MSGEGEKAGPTGQLPLRIGLRESLTFANFLHGANGAALHTLEEGREPFVYLWGPAGCGKSHLLQAAAHVAGPEAAVYLPLGELPPGARASFDGLEAFALVCIDDLQALAAEAAWQQGLFHLFNRVRDAGGRLLAAGRHGPHGLGVELPDLLSRLTWGPVFQLQPLDDAEKLAALQRRAAERGFELPQEVGSYLLRRSPRDLHALFALLDRLDRASLAAKRRLTVPFVRDLLG